MRIFHPLVLKVAIFVFLPFLVGLGIGRGLAGFTKAAMTSSYAPMCVTGEISVEHSLMAYESVE